MHYRSLPLLIILGCSGGSSASTVEPTCKSERNDTPSLARTLQEMTDNASSPQKFFVVLDSASDEVFLQAAIKDRGSGGDPKITVSAPAGYEVTTWFSCLEGTVLTHSCRHGSETVETDIAPEKGCISVAPSASVTGTTDCSDSSDDDGTLLIRVRAKEGAVCRDFEMTLEVTE